MNLFRREWAPREAEEWTVHDTFAVIVSPLVYILITIGCMMSFLMIWVGFVLLAVGIVLLVVLIRVIDPKLSAVSEEYEKKQKHYIEELERKVKWED
jgi:ABC-type multidrug transport system permease subunit